MENDEKANRTEMKDNLNKSTLDRLVGDAVSKKYIYGAVFHVSSENEKINLISASGEMKEDSLYYIASINKLFISAIVLKLYAQKKLDLHAKIAQHLPHTLVNGLHIYKGRDYSNHLSILNLISHTSGLPCYLIDKQANGIKVMTELEAGIDQPWPIDKVIREVKKMKTHFPPGQKGRAKYVDTNHQILSLIIEKITGEPINGVLRNLFEELNLNDTFVYEDANNRNFIPIRYKTRIINIPLFLRSTKNDIISTAKDQMTFLKAFFHGYFFPKERLKELEKWNRIFFPFKYGIGIQKFSMPRLLSPFHPVPDMVGHCGSIGSVAFYVPERDIYMTGSINQQARPNVAFQTMIKIINKLICI